jgi:hypothetical protein
MVEGRRRWVARMREAKARGEIERFPGGRRARGLPPLSRHPTIRKAQRKLEERKAQMAKGVVVPASDATKSEKLGEAVDVGLDRVLAFLNRDIEPEADPKLFALQISTALSAISTQARLDAAALQAASGGIGGLDDDDLDERLQRASRRLAVLEAEAMEELQAAEGRESEVLADDDISDVDAVEADRPAEAAE